MAAVQPFISGAISKTINMPEESTAEEVMDAYTESWRLGLKAVAIYRDNSKRVQPLSSGTSKGAKESVTTVKVEERIVYRPIRRKLDDTRRSLTHKFSIGGHEGYITAGLYDDGSPGEIFITMAKEGSTISGLMDAFATAVSYAFAIRGVPAVALRRQIQPRKIRTQRLDWQSRDPLRKVDHGLHFPRAGNQGPGPGIRSRRSGRHSKVASNGAESTTGAPIRPSSRGRSVMFGMRRSDDPKRLLLQMRKLRRNQRL